MNKRFGVLAAIATAVAAFVLAPAPVFADSATRTYLLEMEAPNTAQAPNGDSVAITGEGQFSVHPKSVEAEGSFTHTDSEGNVLATGTWTATQLLTYQSYGCGVVFGTAIPPELCGGRVMMRVLLTPDGTTLQIPGILSVYCVIGDKRPSSAEEGVRLVVPGHINFNDVTGGENVYIQTS
jgi:hypothetical protein